MTGKNFDLKNLICDAWENTLKKTASVDDSAERSSARINRQRSIDWVDYLGKGFREYYNNDDQCVFWRKNYDNRRQFGLNELLFDILVCQIKEVPSILHEKPLPFVSKCYWQVESELNKKSSREITKDFSKLVMGHSDNKLFISSYQRNHQKKVRKMCSEIAPYCTGKLYLCFIDHPRAWKEGPENPILFRWGNGDWECL